MSRRNQSEFSKRAKPPPEESDPEGEKGESGSGNRASGHGWCLGATTGAVASGAWAARYEVANMLEMKCDPSILVELIRSGQEGSQALSADGRLILGLRSLRKPEVESVLEKALSAKGSEDTWSLIQDGEDFSEVVHGQLAIMESLKKREDELPPWAVPASLQERPKSELGGVDSQSSPPWATKEGRGQSLSFPGDDPRSLPSYPEGESLIFGKRAHTPEDRMDRRATKAIKVPKLEEVEAEQFSKRCKRFPEKEDEELDEEEIKKMRRGRGRPHDGTSMEDREKSEMNRFCSAAFDIFEKMNILGIKMDLLSIVEKEGKVDKERFLFHTAPSRASTGLNYTNVVKNLMTWIGNFSRPEDPGNAHPFETLRLVEYIEYLIQGGIGRNTPKTLLFGLDFFGKVFGFDPTGTIWQRSKRLANRYAKAKPEMTNRAPQFSRETLLSLEKIVLDDTFRKTERISAGKLRLCCQASIRYDDDLLNTPLGCLEWIRRRGELAVVGIRAKTKRGKTRARPWVASLMGVDEGNDRWLATLIELVVSSHGRRWIEDDHFGKEIARDGESFTGRPAKMEADVLCVKDTFLKLLKGGERVGMKKLEVELLRWHGAKATFTTLMQHLNVGPKTVRLAGDWSSKEDSMPDIYLREAQLLVMKGQEACLAHLRSGGDFAGFVGAGFAGLPPADGDVGDEGSNSTQKVNEPGASTSAPPPFDGVHASAVMEHFLDDAFDDAGMAKYGRVDEEKEKQLDPTKVESLLVEDTGEEAEYVGFSFDEEPKPTKPGTPTVTAALGEGAAPTETKVDEPIEEVAVDSPLDDDEGDLEGLVTTFVMASATSQNSKLHLAAYGLDKKGRSTMIPVPMCGIRGSFDYVDGGEARDPKTEPCLRCFGKRSSECTKLCNFKVEVLGTYHYCARRCVSSKCGTGGEHLCHIHGCF